MSVECVAEEREDDVFGKFCIVLSLYFLGENFNLSDSLEYDFFLNYLGGETRGAEQIHDALLEFQKEKQVLQNNMENC